MRITRTLSSLAVSAALVFPSLVSAKDVIHLGNVVVPAGFCTIASDSTLGVKLDGVTSYTAWLAYFALGDDRLKLATAEYVKLHPHAIELEVGQYAAQLRKAEARIQRFNIDLGQKVLCK